MGQEERRVAAELSRGQGQRPVDDWVYAAGEPAAPFAEPAAAATTAPLPQAAPNRAGRAVREIVETLLLALVIFLGVRLVVLNFRVDGESMAPNLHNRQMLLVNRNAYVHVDLNRALDLLPGEDRDEERIWYPFEPPERGDVVVFDPPVSSDKPYIKRVIALPGEHVSFDAGYIEINGQRLEEPYIDAEIAECRRDGGCQPDQGVTECGRGRYCGLTLGEEEIYVLGDNRDNSSDSRSFGPVTIENVIGKAWFSYWPVDDVGLVPHYDYPTMPERAAPAALAATPDAGTPEPRAERQRRTERAPRPQRTATTEQP
jgi:signal peptidase I